LTGAGLAKRLTGHGEVVSYLPTKCSIATAVAVDDFKQPTLPPTRVRRRRGVQALPPSRVALARTCAPLNPL